MAIPYKYLKSIGYKLTKVNGARKKVLIKPIPVDNSYPAWRGDGTHYWIGYSDGTWGVMVIRKQHNSYKLVAASSGWSRYTLKELLERIDEGLQRNLKEDYEWFNK